MSLIKITNLTFSYSSSSENVFSGVNLTLDSNWKLGLTGRNGRGKTTLMRILLGELEYKGNIFAKVDFTYFPYKVNNPNLTTLAVVKEIYNNFEDWQLIYELSFLEVSETVLEQTFNTLSPGEKTKVLLATLFLKENNFLLIDEPTNHLDENSRILIGDYLKTKRGFILISHDRVLLDKCTDHTLSINKLDIEITQGNFSTWLNNKENQDNLEIKQNKKLKKEIKQLEISSARVSSWSDKIEKSKTDGTRNSGLRVDKGYVGHKAAKMMQRAKNIERRQDKSIEEKSNLLKNIETFESLKIKQLDFHKNTLITINKLSIYYDSKEIVSNFNLIINKKDRVVINGKNGSGKSSILKLICGEKINYTGEYYKNNQLKISYISQDSSEIVGSLNDYIEKYQLNESLFKAVLIKLDFSREQFDQNISNYSDGEKRKVLLARSLLEASHLIIWDEPLNYLDVFSRIQIEKLILEFEPTILVVEHDKTFVDKIATKIINI